MALKIKYILVMFFTLVIGAQSSRSQDFVAVDSFNYYYDHKNYSNALRFWNEIEIKDLDFELRKRKGNCYHYTHNFDSSLRIYKRVYTKLSLNDTNELIDISINLANAWRNKNCYDSTFGYLEYALKLNSSVNSIHESRIYYSFGKYYSELKENDSAELYYLKSLRLEREIDTGKNESILNDYLNLMRFYQDKADFEKALLYGNEGLNWLKEIKTNQKLWQFNFNYGIGRVYYAMRDWQQVVIYFNNALYHMQSRQNSFEPYINNVLAYAYSQIGELSLDEQFFNKFSVNQLDTLAYVYYLENFGNYFENLKRDYPKAIEKYKHGLVLNKAKFRVYNQKLLTSYWIIGRTYHKYQKYDSSLYYFQRALYCTSKDVDTLDYATNPVDVFNADKRLPEIIARKLESLMAIKLQELEKDSLKSINQLMVANCSYYSHCVEAGLRDKTFMQDRLTALKKEIRRYMLAGMDAAWELYLENHDIYYLEKALHFSETGKYLLVKSMTMQRNLATQLPDSIARLNTLLSNNINRLHMKKVQLEANNDTLPLADLQQQIFNLILQQDSLRNIIFQKYPAGINREFNELTLDKISSSVNDGQLLLNYFLEDTVLHVLKISPDTITWQRFHHAQNIRNRVNDLIDFCNPVSDRIIEKHTYQDIASRLTEILVGDTSMFPGIEELMIIPDQELVLLPFEILLKYNPGVKAFYKSLPYLLHEFPISYYHSLYSLPSNSNRENNPKEGFVAIAPRFEGNAEQMRQGYTKIEQAHAEAEYLTGLFDGELLTGKKAQKSNLGPYLRNASVIHFATHTKTDTTGLMNTGLVLPSDTSKNTFDPLLTSEICCMDIPADMVMLSACKSGSGQLLDGEGVISLGWAFEYAGSSSVGYSLFSLDDASANQIMTSFYEGLKEGLPKNVALQQAKQDFLKTVTSIKTHPKYWAGLAVIGDQSPLPGLSSQSNKLRAVTFLAGLLVLVLIAFRYRRLLFSK